MMQTWQRPLMQIVLLVSVALVLSAWPVAADGGLCTPVLTSLDGPGFVALEALAVSVTVSCDAGTCVATSEQDLFLINRDQVAPATLKLGFGDCEATLAALTADNAILATDDDTQRITLAPRAKAVVHATITSQSATGPVLAGKLQLSTAARWGAVENSHIELRLPTSSVGPAQTVTPAPDRLTLDGAVWDWTGETHDIDWAMIAPALQQELAEAARNQDGLRLAELLATIPDQEPTPPAWRDLTPRILAALQNAVAVEPAPPRTRLLLAQTYLDLAAQRPDRRLNYLLLSLQQLDLVGPDTQLTAELDQQRSDVLYQAALAAQENGDPASALAYLNRAAKLAPQEARIQQAQAKFVLQWGLDLARQGQVAAAIVLLDEAGQVPIAREVARFAPPFQQARTEVTLAPQMRTAAYELTLYEPVAAEISAALTQALEAVGSLPGIIVTEQASSATRRQFAIAIAFDDLPQLRTRQAQLLEALDVYDGLVVAWLAAPWRGEIAAWGLTTPWWGREFAYAEETDTAVFQQAWQVEADYASWWLVELRAKQPTAEANQAAHELSLLALREQTALWQTLPERAQWTYELAHPEISNPPKWQVSSGEQRPLTYRQRWYDWQRAAQMGLGLGLALIALTMLLALFRRRRERRHTRPQERQSL